MVKSFLILLAVSLFLLTGCVHVAGPKFKAPPGQVQKATGYNPASGKVKLK